ncbi:MAG: group III truncated hemoglobin [Cytophagales bacterium]|nr:group III truncated hemoglobin [Cytophagales bacterium]
MKDIQDRTDIIILIDTFYKKALIDKIIGHFFTEVVPLNLEAHLPKMYDFWESTLFHKASYQGNPMKVHLDLHEKSSMTYEHFDQWLKLFNDTTDELFAGANAEQIKTRGLSIATMMKIKIMG